MTKTPKYPYIRYCVYILHVCVCAFRKPTNQPKRVLCRNFSSAWNARRPPRAVTVLAHAMTESRRNINIIMCRCGRRSNDEFAPSQCRRSAPNERYLVIASARNRQKQTNIWNNIWCCRWRATWPAGPAAEPAFFASRKMQICFHIPNLSFSFIQRHMRMYLWIQFGNCINSCTHGIMYTFNAPH